MPGPGSEKSSGGGAKGAQAGGEPFYKYVDEAGVQHITSSLERVPERARAGAKRIELEIDPEASVERPGEGLRDAAKEELKRAEHIAEKGLAEAKEIQTEIGAVIPFVRE